MFYLQGLGADSDIARKRIRRANVVQSDNEDSDTHMAEEATAKSEEALEDNTIEEDDGEAHSDISGIEVNDDNAEHELVYPDSDVDDNGNLRGFIDDNDVEMTSSGNNDHVNVR